MPRVHIVTFNHFPLSNRHKPTRHYCTSNLHAAGTVPMDSLLCLSGIYFVLDAQTQVSLLPEALHEVHDAPPVPSSTVLHFVSDGTVNSLPLRDASGPSTSDDSHRSYSIDKHTFALVLQTETLHASSLASSSELSNYEPDS